MMENTMDLTDMTRADLLRLKADAVAASQEAQAAATATTVRVEAELAARGKQYVLSVTQREAIRAAIKYVRPHDPDLAHQLHLMINEVTP